MICEGTPCVANDPSSTGNHLFIINSILNEAVQEHIEIDILISDYKQCFDSLWLDEVSNDFFENGVQNRNLAVMYEANKVNRVSVMTPSGVSAETVIEKIVMQGETLAPLQCSSLVDQIGKECIAEDKHLYMFRGSVGVPPLT